MFKLMEFPPESRETFHKGGVLWPLAVSQAVAGGTRDLDKLTNLVFFMHHPERMTGSTGSPLVSGEPNFKRLADEWNGFRVMVRPFLPTGPRSGGGTGKTLAQSFTDFVKKVRQRGGKALSAADEADLKRRLTGLSPDEIKTLEWILVLWPRFGQASKMYRMIEIVTAEVRKSDRLESARGRFDERAGGATKARLSKAAKETAFGQCLNFLANEGLPELYGGEEARLEAAMKRYREVSRERKQKKQAHGGGTLSIMASELRLEGLVGPINVLKWRGTADKGRHEPDPVDLFDRLSGAGEGWYFFLASVVSFHTFLVAVHVTSGGSNRVYFEIQDGQSVRKSRKDLRGWFDEEFRPNKKLAASRVWQVYRKPFE